jgi:hypothetical protein
MIRHPIQYFGGHIIVRQDDRIPLALQLVDPLQRWQHAFAMLARELTQGTSDADGF